MVDARSAGSDPQRAEDCSPTGPTGSRPASCPPPSRRGRRASSATSSSRMWDWADPKALSARRDRDRQAQSHASTPTARSTARPRMSTDFVPVLDPVTHTAYAVKHAGARSEDAVVARTMPMQPSPYWGDEPIWDGQTSMHNPMFDEKGRVWFTVAHPRRRPTRPSARRARAIRRRRCSRSTKLGAASRRCTIRRPRSSR